MRKVTKYVVFIQSIFVSISIATGAPGSADVREQLALIGSARLIG